MPDYGTSLAAAVWWVPLNGVGRYPQDNSGVLFTPPAPECSPSTLTTLLRTADNRHIAVALYGLQCTMGGGVP
eukprot:scaffold93807_cov51-Phaeocystis_antarctica.AAC.1